MVEAENVRLQKKIWILKKSTHVHRKTDTDSSMGRLLKIWDI